MHSHGLFLIAAGAALSASLLAGCGGGGGFADAAVDEPPPADGTVSLQWTVKDAQGNTVPCSDINAQAVTLTLRNTGAQGGSTEVFGCSSTNGQSPGYAPGTYRIDFELTGAVGTLSTAPQQMIVIKSGQNTALTPIDFVVDPTGGIATNLQVAGGVANCGTTPAADIGSVTITLDKPSDSTCAKLGTGGNVVFALSASASSGGAPAGTYTVNCAAPATLGCVNADQQFTVSGVKSGSYQFHVRAKKNGSTPGDGDCYFNDDAITVPAAGMTRTQTLNLSFGDNVAGC